MSTRQARSHRTQQGMSLLVVLIALLVVSFASITLLRSGDTGTLISGNLAFQKTALAAGDAGTEAAVDWLVANSIGNTLFSDDPGNGYYASTADGCDLTTTRTESLLDDVRWAGADPGDECNMDALAVAPEGVTDGFTVRYVINRVCNAEGDPNAVVAADGVTPMSCSRVGAGPSEGSTKGGASYGNLPLSGSGQTYYRVTTRVEGPRNTARYVQALVII